eukprot:TRINITY_DN3963_c0_g1_i1.p1 TRINITY_DN3963_c0_g1~~TRINITY_DN3963_c0_g1_i1.p1  ORF type:complete len:416 (+),score=144.67 TRINITY_DN3963_c0_g1_i1:858-2105(+)
MSQIYDTVDISAYSHRGPAILLKFLEKHTFQDLHLWLGIFCRERANSTLVDLWPDVDTPHESQMAWECQGTVIDAKSHECVSFSNFQAFPWEGTYVSKLNWENIRISEKLDGIRVNLFWHGNRWHASMSPFENLTQEIFWELWEELGYRHPDEISTKFTFSFEVVGPKFQKIIFYEKPKIVLIGCTCKDEIYSWRNIDEISQKYGWEVARDVTEEIRNFFRNENSGKKKNQKKGENPISAEKIRKFLSEKIDIEGYFVQDDLHRACYVTSPFYDLLKEVRDNQDLQTQELILLRLIADTAVENSKTLNHYPFKSSFNGYLKIQLEFQELCKYVDSGFREIKERFGLDPNAFVREVPKYGKKGVFIHFLKDEDRFPSACDWFGRETYRRKVHKYLTAWWTEYFLSSAPRVLSNCYK